jgi:homoserine dehydrogenase
MLDDGMAYADAVAEAQRCGYAEADPTLDVSGGDTAHKLTVLASLAFGLNLDFVRKWHCSRASIGLRLD